MTDPNDPFAEPPAEEDEIHPDPDAAPTVEGRIDQAVAELRKLLRSAATATAIVAAILALWDVTHGEGFALTTGFLIGAAVATWNLWLLANGWFAVMRGRALSPRSFAAFGGSFFALIAIAFFVVLLRREWVLGFALGLTTPALAGILYGRTLKS